MPPARASRLRLFSKIRALPALRDPVLSDRTIFAPEFDTEGRFIIPDLDESSLDDFFNAYQRPPIRKVDFTSVQRLRGRTQVAKQYYIVM
ncbi:hypothetical protein HDU87_001487 [Geranomyces variabilis]|uniref:Uncharacterized protein n=1 Tax=Geranomyces variabilis TaxID=109894 RepID=A0AAD5XI39_9FUNG|nr:hypothetical protein HDU87_001487 [Geranomyces variabilis]